MKRDNAKHLERCKQARAELAWRGVCIGQWAREHGFAPRLVYDVLNGRNLGLRGDGHRAAVILGIKEGAI